jgi:hypothetical protein
MPAAGSTVRRQRQGRILVIRMEREAKRKRWHPGCAVMGRC